MLKSICIVDDSSIFLFTAQRMIKHLGIAEKIITLKNGKEALEYFKDLHRNKQPLPDLTLLDINMPVMNGWEFLEAMEKNDISDFPVYILSSSVDPSDVEKSKNYKLLKGYLFKPLNTENLKSIALEIAEVY